MKNESRTIHSIKNIFFAFMSQGAYTVIAFVCRTVFIYTLGKNYLGLSGLFTDIFSLLSLGELGIGTAILYSMYEPVANNDYKKVSALLSFYKRVYFIVGMGITIIGLALTPFLNYFISDLPNLPELPYIYILTLFNTSFSYFFVYKKSVLTAYQNDYIASIVYTITIVTQNIMQMICLLMWKNYILYLIIQLVFTMINNIVVSVYVDKKYPYLKKYKSEKVDKNTLRMIVKNIKAMFTSKISSAIVSSTDNILISKFVSTVLLGYYSNYAMFVSIIRQVFSKIFEGITGSVGNIVVTETEERSYTTFKNIWFVNFWMISFCSISLFVIIKPFIIVWIGQEYVMSQLSAFIICVNMYMRFIRNTQLIYIDTCGLFVNVQWKCIAEALINLVASLIFVVPMNMGIFGVLLGTLTSTLLTSFWYEPKVVYNKCFGKSSKTYFCKFGIYAIVTLITGTIIEFIVSIIKTQNIYLNLLVSILICGIGINLCYYFVFRKTEEFKYFETRVISTVKRKKNE